MFICSVYHAAIERQIRANSNCGKSALFNFRVVHYNVIVNGKCTMSDDSPPPPVTGRGRGCGCGLRLWLVRRRHPCWSHL